MNTFGYQSIFRQLFSNKLCVGFLLFIIIIAVYLISSGTWGLVSEDYKTLFQASHTKSFVDAFIEGDVEQVEMGTINASINYQQTGFFSVFYRPFWLIFCKVAYSIFGLNACVYYILSIVLHALVSLLLFYLLSLIVDIRMSAILTLFFAFHPSLSWIGKFDFIQHFISLMFGLGSIICFNLMLKFEKLRYLLMISGLLLFLLCLLTRETLIFLPLLLMVTENKRNKFFALDLLIGFCLVILCYGFLRNINYPLFPLGSKFVAGWGNVYNYFSALFLFFFDSFGAFITYFTLWGVLKHIKMLPLFNILRVFCYLLLTGWLAIGLFFTNIRKLWIFGAFFIGFFFVRPWPFNGVAPLMFLITCLYFFTNDRPRLILITLLIGCVFMWPQLLQPFYNDRICYEALPVFILAYAYLLKYSNLNRKLFHLNRLAYLLVPFLLLTTLETQQKRYHTGKKISDYDSRVLELKAYESTLKKNSVFVIDVDCGIVYALFLHGITDKEAPHFNYRCVRLVSNLSFSDSFSIEIVNCGVRITSKDRENAWIRHENLYSWPFPLFLDSIEINDKNSRGDIFDLTFKFKKQFFYENMKIIIWSESDKKFVVV